MTYFSHQCLARVLCNTLSIAILALTRPLVVSFEFCDREFSTRRVSTLSTYPSAVSGNTNNSLEGTFWRCILTELASPSESCKVECWLNLQVGTALGPISANWFRLNITQIHTFLGIQASDKYEHVKPDFIQTSVEQMVRQKRGCVFYTLTLHKSYRNMLFSYRNVAAHVYSSNSTRNSKKGVWGCIRHQGGIRPLSRPFCFLGRFQWL